MSLHPLLILLPYFLIVPTNYGQDYANKDLMKDISSLSKFSGIKDINDMVSNSNFNNSNNLKFPDKTDYKKLFDNIEFSSEEEKLIGIENDDEKYSKNDIKYTNFYNIKYKNLNWDLIKNRDILSVDLYSEKQKSRYIIQDLGVDGSSTFNLMPEMISDIGTVLGYSGYERYKYKEDDIKFFDTKMPIGDVKASFNLDSGDGFLTDIRTYFSANKNIHLGISTNIMLRRRILSQKTTSMLNLAIINFPVSSYFLYKSTDEKMIGLLNIVLGNYIHSDHGGTCVDENPKYIGDTDVQDVLDNVLNRRLIDISLLGYLQYKLKNICIYGQYNLNYDNNTLRVYGGKEKKEDDVDGRHVYVVRYKDKIKDKTINGLFKNPELGKYYMISNSDKYLENKFEVGVKDSILFRRNTYFNYCAYYSIKFSTRVIDSNYNTTTDIKNETFNRVLDRQWYIDPFTIGCILNAFNLTFSPNLTVAGKSVFFKLYLGYTNRFITFDLDFSRHKIPLLYCTYKCFNDNLRSYDNKYDKAPLDLYLNIEGNIKIKDILKIKPRFTSNISWNKMYFKQDFVENRDINISIPGQNQNALLHLIASVDMNIKFVKYFFIEVSPIFNKKLYFKKNVDYINNENDDNVPFFSLSSRIYFYKVLSKNVAEITTGFELFWRTNYNPNSFDMITQQYFNRDYEDKFNVFFKPKVSAYFNFRFGNFIGSFKLSLIDIFWDVNTFSSKYYPNNNEYYMFTIQYLMY